MAGTWEPTVDITAPGFISHHQGLSPLQQPLANTGKIYDWTEAG